jgi:hypothetical protein
MSVLKRCWVTWATVGWRESRPLQSELEGPRSHSHCTCLSIVLARGTTASAGMDTRRLVNPAYHWLSVPQRAYLDELGQTFGEFHVDIL